MACSYLAEACHELVPVEDVRPCIHALTHNFITERNTGDAISAGTRLGKPASLPLSRGWANLPLCLSHEAGQTCLSASRGWALPLCLTRLGKPASLPLGEAGQTCLSASRGAVFRRREHPPPETELQF